MTAKPSFLRRWGQYLVFHDIAPSPVDATDEWWSDEVNEPMVDVVLSAAIRARDDTAAALASVVAKGSGQLTICVGALVATTGRQGSRWPAYPLGGWVLRRWLRSDSATYWCYWLFSAPTSLQNLSTVCR